MSQPKRIYRSRTNRVIAGVCGGVGDYLNVDPVIVRILWIVLALSLGAGVIAYFICWLVIPLEPVSAGA